MFHMDACQHAESAKSFEWVGVGQYEFLRRAAKRLNTWLVGSALPDRHRHLVGSDGAAKR